MTRVTFDVHRDLHHSLWTMVRAERFPSLCRCLAGRCLALLLPARLCLTGSLGRATMTPWGFRPSLIPRTDVPLHINEYTKRTLAFFMGKGRVHMENWIRRSGKYFPLMSRIFAEEGLPPELMLLSLPESGLNPTARSWAKAVGLWQFMKATGAQYGLRSNYWYDERRDFEKATRAADRHMKDI